MSTARKNLNENVRGKLIDIVIEAENKNKQFDCCQKRENQLQKEREKK
jgi:hypothetical protein